MEHLLNTAVLIIRVTHYKKLTSTQLVRTKLPLDLGPLLTHRATGAADPRSVVARTKEAPKHGAHPASLASNTLTATRKIRNSKFTGKQQCKPKICPPLRWAGNQQEPFLHVSLETLCLLTDNFRSDETICSINEQTVKQQSHLG